MKSIEELSNELIAEFKVKMKAAVDEVADESIANLYCDILPHAENDTLFNIHGSVKNAIEKLLEGKFTVTDDNKLNMTDRNGISFHVQLNDKWDNTILNNVVKMMPTCPKDLKIAQLEQQIIDIKNIHASMRNY